MQESKNIEERDFLSMLFSFKGRINRKEYFIYGIVIPLILIGLGLFIREKMVDNTPFLVLLVVALIIQIATSIKRGRDRNENIILLVILLFIPYISLLVMLYLLFAPSKEPSTNSEKKSKVLLYILLGSILIFIGGIALSKMQNSKQDDMKKNLTCTKMETIIYGLEMFKMDNDNYPKTEDGLVSLVPYYLNDIPKDLWGNKIEYLSHKNGYELFSYGEDGVESSDDIYLSECKQEKGEKE